MNPSKITARVGNLNLYKVVDGAQGSQAPRYVLTTLDGEEVGTFPTAKAANTYAIARVAAAHKARQSA